MAPSYHKEEGVASHPGARKHSFQYDRRSDWHFSVQVVTWNMGSLSGKRGEVCEELSKMMIDMCYL